MAQLPIELENYIVELSGAYKDIFKSVLQQIRMQRIRRGIQSVTHCHGCGKHTHVGFHGYASEFCNKRCWRDSSGVYYWYETDFDNTYPLTLSTYHMFFRYYYAKGAAVWPMRKYDSECNNECILNRETVRIPGYNVNLEEE